MKDKKISVVRRGILKAAGIGLLLPAITATAAQLRGISGRLAPELDVDAWIDEQGRDTHFKLADQRGKFVFLELWQAWCPGCHSHGFPTLQKIHAEFKDSPHFIAVGIQTTFEGYSVNTEDKLRTMQKRYDLPIVMGHDAGDAQTGRRPNTMVSYRSGGTPWAILISPDGIVLYNDFGIDAQGTIDYLTEELSNLG